MRVLFLACALLVLSPCAQSQTAQKAVAGYTPLNDVTSYLNLDQAQKAIEGFVGATPPDFAAAWAKYNEGTLSYKKLGTEIGNSAMATELKMKGASSTSVIQAYFSYWNSYPLQGFACAAGSAVSGCSNYADQMVFLYANATGHATGASSASRAQIIKKGAALHIGWLNVVSELSHAVAKAKAADATTKKYNGQDPTEAIAKHVDIAWAYYAGSEAKYMPESIARKRAVEFGTCNAIPNAVLQQFKDAQNYASTATFDKTKLEEAAQNIVPLITVPLVQSCIRYLSVEDGKFNDFSDAAKAEQFAFCSAVLPQMKAADAATLRTMIDSKFNPTAGVNASFPASGQTVNKQTAIAALESSYAQMGITKVTIGLFKSTTTVADEKLCTQTLSSSSRMMASVFTAIMGAAVAVYAAF